MRKNAPIIPLERIETIKSSLAGKKTVLVGGCFDLIHFAHLTFLKKAKKAGNFLIVALESDEFIKKRKNKIPVHTQRQRAEILAALIMIDLVVLLPYLKNDEEYYDMVKKIRPSIIAITEGDSQTNNKKKQAAKAGAEVKIVTAILKKFSSSQILNHATIFSD